MSSSNKNLHFGNAMLLAVALLCLAQVCDAVFLDPSTGQHQCLGPHGTTFQANERYKTANFVYECTPDGDRMYLKRVACVTPRDDTVNHLDTYIMDRYVYQCDVENNRQIMTGCINDAGEKVNVGGSWLHPPTAKCQYRNACKKENEEVYISGESCRFTNGSTVAEVKGGCWHDLQNGVYLTCAKPSGRGSGLFINFVRNAEQLAALTGGPDCVLEFQK